MLLNETQKDALAELINIGFGRAASALSMLVGQRVILEAPQVTLYPLGELEKVLTDLTDEVTTVHQVFTGQIAGDAMLLMDTPSASSLADLLGGGQGTRHTLTEEDREALGETGNILLNAFTGSFGNLLQVHIRFTVPRLRFESLRNMMHSLMIEDRNIEFALVVRVNFRLTHGDVSGYVIIVMSIQSLESLLDAMKQVGYLE